MSSTEKSCWQTQSASEVCERAGQQELPLYFTLFTTLLQVNMGAFTTSNSPLLSAYRLETLPFNLILTLTAWSQHRPHRLTTQSRKTGPTSGDNRQVQGCLSPVLVANQL